MTLEQKTQNILLKQFEETRSRTLELVKTLKTMISVYRQHTLPVHQNGT